jgi:hypothetical protein
MRVTSVTRILRGLQISERKDRNLYCCEGIWGHETLWKCTRICRSPNLSTPVIPGELRLAVQHKANGPNCQDRSEPQC